MKRFTVDDTAEGVSLLLDHARHAATNAIEKASATVYVNSWCLGTESMAMWDKYGDKGRGVDVCPPGTLHGAP